MNRQAINISIKMILAGVITLFVTYLLNIEYYTTAAAVSILSIQLTKRDFISIALKRIVSGIAAILLSALMFYLLGQTFIVFALFLIIFIFASWFFNASEGIVASVVLVTHFLIVSEITVAFMLEEVLLLLIAIGIAFLINMFYPEVTKTSIKRSLLEVDAIIEDELINIVNILNNKESRKSVNYQKELDKIMSDAKLIDRNIIIQNDHRYVTYLYMRNMQLQTLFKIENNIKQIKIIHKYQNLIANFVRKVGENIGFDNNAAFLLVELEDLRVFFMDEPLPQTRKEFEVRAILFQILLDLENFLNYKIDFHLKYPNFIIIEEENKWI